MEIARGQQHLTAVPVLWEDAKSDRKNTTEDAAAICLLSPDTCKQEKTFTFPAFSLTFSTIATYFFLVFTSEDLLITLIHLVTTKRFDSWIYEHVPEQLVRNKQSLHSGRFNGLLHMVYPESRAPKCVIFPSMAFPPYTSTYTNTTTHIAHHHTYTLTW